DLKITERYRYGFKWFVFLSVRRCRYAIVKVIVASVRPGVAGFRDRFTGLDQTSGPADPDLILGCVLQIGALSDVEAGRIAGHAQPLHHAVAFVRLAACEIVLKCNDWCVGRRGNGLAGRLAEFGGKVIAVNPLTTMADAIVGLPDAPHFARRCRQIDLQVCDLDLGDGVGGWTPDHLSSLEFRNVSPAVVHENFVGDRIAVAAQRAAKFEPTLQDQPVDFECAMSGVAVVDPAVLVHLIAVAAAEGDFLADPFAEKSTGASQRGVFVADRGCGDRSDENQRCHHTQETCAHIELLSLIRGRDLMRAAEIAWDGGSTSNRL